MCPYKGSLFGVEVEPACRIAPLRCVSVLFVLLFFFVWALPETAPALQREVEAQNSFPTRYLVAVFRGNGNGFNGLPWRFPGPARTGNYMDPDP